MELVLMTTRKFGQMRRFQPIAASPSAGTPQATHSGHVAGSLGSNFHLTAINLQILNRTVAVALSKLLEPGFAFCCDIARFQPKVTMTQLSLPLTCVKDTLRSGC